MFAIFFRVHQASLVFLVLLVLLVHVVVLCLPWSVVKKVQWAMGMNIEMSQKKMKSIWVTSYLP